MDISNNNPRNNTKEKFFTQLINSEFVKKIKEDSWIRELVDQIDEEAWGKKKEVKDYYLDMSAKLKNLTKNDYLYEVFDNFFKSSFKKKVPINPGDRTKPETPQNGAKMAEIPTQLNLTNEKVMPNMASPQAAQGVATVDYQKQVMPYLERLKNNPFLKQFIVEISANNGGDTQLPKIAQAIANGSSLEAYFHRDNQHFKEKVKTIANGLARSQQQQQSQQAQQQQQSQQAQQQQQQQQQQIPYTQNDKASMTKLDKQEKIPEPIQPKSWPIPQTRTEMLEMIHRQFRNPFTPLELMMDKVSLVDDEPKKRMKHNPSPNEEKNMMAGTY